MVFKKYPLTALLFFILTSSALAQKIKYKELFVLLNAKQYAEAEPFLRKYLKDNQENSNAFLYMGYIFEEKALANDVLKETDKLVTNADSAVIFFDKTFKSLDERELKKSDEYYQSFSRRDLRTGEFGLKLSDIQFELEKRMKALRDKRSKVLDAKAKFVALQRNYDRNLTLFKSLADRYQDQREFYLRSDDEQTADLRSLTRKYDTCLMYFNDYKAALQAIGKTGYNPELTPRDINNFKKDGFSPTDFLQDVVQVWDFKRWAGQHLDVIETEIKPLADKLTKIDADLNALGEKIKKDSVSVSKELREMATRIKATALEKFDPKPFPFDVFRLKISELEYGSLLADTRQHRDSADVELQAVLLSKQCALLRAVDSLGTLAQKGDLPYEAQNYKAFIQTAYGSLDLLSKTMKSSTDLAVAELARKQKQVERLNILKHWIVDATDSIPVTNEVKSARFTQLTLVPNSYTVGFTFPDSVTRAYFYAITPSRQPKIKATVKLDSASFGRTKLPLLKSVTAVDAGKQNYYVIVYSEEWLKDKVRSYVFKVAPTGLVWSNFYYLDGTPLEASISTPNGELLIKVTTNSGNKLITILPDGKAGG